MPKATTYHNPRCSKSRETLQILQAHEIEHVIIEYLKTPLNKDEIKMLLTLLNIPAMQLIRQKEAAFTEQKLNDPSLNEDDLIHAMTKHPILIERPIVVYKERAVIARPPENVLEIL